LCLGSRHGIGRPRGRETAVKAVDDDSVDAQQGYG
jgi:hypothetical protein